MPESRLAKIVRELLEDIATDVVEERVVSYIIKELRLGRPLPEILKDPYVKNRVNEEQLRDLLQNKELIEAVEQELAETLGRDIRFGRGEETGTK